MIILLHGIVYHNENITQIKNHIDVVRIQRRWTRLKNFTFYECLKLIFTETNISSKSTQLELVRYYISNQRKLGRYTHQHIIIT